jgi:hypothetical protein
VDSSNSSTETVATGRVHWSYDRVTGLVLVGAALRLSYDRTTSDGAVSQHVIEFPADQLVLD